MLDNIQEKIQRFYKDNTLVNQDYIKDGSMSVALTYLLIKINRYRFQRVALG
jgi:elongation factor Ts